MKKYFLLLMLTYCVLYSKAQNNYNFILNDSLTKLKYDNFNNGLYTFKDKGSPQNDSIPVLLAVEIKIIGANTAEKLTTKLYDKVYNDGFSIINKYNSKSFKINTYDAYEIELELKHPLLNNSIYAYYIVVSDYKKAVGFTGLSKNYSYYEKIFT
ncbi:MAG: hypothetical protein IPN14_04075 [Bacteroidetes bacterium]|nr:hypothetical protein [Bacteroidota bacterium]